MNLQDHWNHVYRTNGPTDVSWYQRRPEVSLRLIAATGLGPAAALIDVGGGAAVLVDCLLDAGFKTVAVLDLSAVALECARQRLGGRATAVTWIEADVTAFRPDRPFALWHDRAVFHFLTGAPERRRYVDTLRHALAPDGHVILATFAPDGPTRCSGLEVRRHDAQSIVAELGDRFELLEQVDEQHSTPWQSTQHFRYFRLRRTRA